MKVKLAYQVSLVVTTKECTHQGSAISSDDAHLLCEDGISLWDLGEPVSLGDALSR